MRTLYCRCKWPWSQLRSQWCSLGHYWGQKDLCSTQLHAVKRSNLTPTCSRGPYHIWCCCITILCDKAGEGMSSMCTHDTMQSSGSLETKWPLIWKNLCNSDHTLHWSHDCRHTKIQIAYICRQVFFQTTLHLTGTLSSHFPQDGIHGYIGRLLLSSGWSQSIWLHHCLECRGCHSL